jgi:hypothetical protein
MADTRTCGMTVWMRVLQSNYGVVAPFNSSDQHKVKKIWILNTSSLEGTTHLKNKIFTIKLLICVDVFLTCSLALNCKTISNSKYFNLYCLISSINCIQSNLSVNQFIIWLSLIGQIEYEDTSFRRLQYATVAICCDYNKLCKLSATEQMNLNYIFPLVHILTATSLRRIMCSGSACFPSCTCPVSAN